jgi:glycerol-3-phosphate acyltransferase PlsY
MPKAFVVLAIIFVAAAALVRIMSVASMLAAAVFPVAILVLYPDRPVLLAFAVVAIPLVVWAHRTNIKRLLRGEEPKITMGRPAEHQGGSDS